MQKLIYFLPYLILIFVVLGVTYIDPLIDISPAINIEYWQSNTESDTIRPWNFPYPTEWNFNFANTPPLNAGTVGALLYNGKYYINNWMNGVCFMLPNTGPNGSPSIAGMTAGGGTYRLRDLTTDGQFIYGGEATSILYKMNATFSLVSQFSLTGTIRGITWDPNRKAFWYCDFTTNINCRDTNNNLKHTIQNTLAAKYGLAFDTSTFYGDSAFVFCWDQGTGTSCNLVRFYITSPTPYQVNNWLFTLPAFSGPAGGAEIVVDPYTNPARLMLLLNYQNFALVGYKMKDVIIGLEEGNETVRDFVLNQNYPNPFNPKTRISFVLSKAALINLEVFNSAGEKVATIFRGHTQAGEHLYLFDCSDFTSGVYFYRITVDEQYMATKKMILIR